MMQSRATDENGHYDTALIQVNYLKSNDLQPSIRSLPQTISINNDYMSSLPLHAKGWRVCRGLKRIR